MPRKEKCIVIVNYEGKKGFPCLNDTVIMTNNCQFKFKFNSLLKTTLFTVYNCFSIVQYEIWFENEKVII